MIYLLRRGRGGVVLCGRVAVQARGGEILEDVAHAVDPYVIVVLWLV